MTNDKTFAIIGAGIGGLTLAIALQQKGFTVKVYENAPVLKPIGAGLVLAGNAVKALTEIGIAENVIRSGKVIKKFAIKADTGRILTVADSTKITAKYGVTNSFTIHRADLHAVLLSYLAEGTVVLGKGCTDFTQHDNGVELYFSDGSSALADYIIACDGIHSVVRQKLLPDSKPRYSGHTCWRAVINNCPVALQKDETSETWGQGSRFGMVPLSNERLYWFACLNAEPQNPVMKAFKIPDLLQCFSNYHPPVSDILKHTQEDQLIWADIIDIKPIHRFAFGNTVLLGDAAHATTPNLGQGACMAIEDAVVLANCIQRCNTGEEAFKEFEGKRIKRTTKIINDSRAIGKIAQLDNPFLIALRNAAIRLTPSRVAEQQIKFLYEVSFS